MYPGRRATRICIESQVVIVCGASGAWVLGVGRLANAGIDFQDGIRTPGCQIRRRYPLFAKTFEKHSFCGRTGDMFGRSGAALARRKNKNPDNSATKSKRHAFEMGREVKSHTVALHINGQWSMPVRHKASPFWAQAVKRSEVVKKLQELLHDLFFVIVFFLPYRFTGDCDYSNKYNRFGIANNILHDITAQLNYQ